MKLFVRVKIRTKEEKVEKIDETHFMVSVKELPHEGKANVAIIRVLAKHFHLAPSRITLVSGFASRQKTFTLQ